jgi:hypothetical protein
MESVREERLRWLLRAVAFLHEGGAEPINGLVLPTGKYFPDAFDGSAKAVSKLAARMLSHAGLGDVHADIELIAPDGESAGSCKSGACSKPAPKALARRRVVATDDGYAVAVSTGEVGHATALTTALARAASAVFLAEAEIDAEIEPSEREAFIDVAGALLGFGVLLANGSHMVHKGCGGVTIQSATRLPVEEQVVLLAIFCQLHDINAKTARSELDAEPRRWLDEAVSWTAANAGVVGLVRSDRLAIDADSYRLAPARGWLARVLGIGRAKGPSVPTDDELERMASRISTAAQVDPEKARRMAALREIVDEQLE